MALGQNQLCPAHLNGHISRDLLRWPCDPKILPPLPWPARLRRSGADAEHITIDGRCSPAQRAPRPNYPIDASLGKQVGNNFFHSFGQFGLATPPWRRSNVGRSLISATRLAFAFDRGDADCRGTRAQSCVKTRHNGLDLAAPWGACRDGRHVEPRVPTAYTRRRKRPRTARAKDWLSEERRQNAKRLNGV
jgi:hypothetical protein